MSDESKSAKGGAKTGSGQYSDNKAHANVSVLKLPANTEAKAASKGGAGTQKKKKPQQSNKAAKPATKPQKQEKEVKAISTTAKTETKTGNLIKEKTMAKNSNANANVPFDNIAKEAAEISREYSEACVKSGTILMKGVEDFVGVVMSLAQSSAEKQAQFIKEAMSSKTINEFAEVQNKIAQSNFDDFMAGATKLTEISTKLLTESAEPVNAQIGKAIKRASESMAA